jgi:subtilase family serine protease
VTGVGGTSLGLDKAGNIAFETGWGDQLDQIVLGSDGVTPTYVDPLPGSVFAGGAGGGTSSLFTEPSYQHGVVPSALSGGYRVSPDISADADPYTGYMIGYRPITDDTNLATGPYQTVTYGGTSLASPLVAAQIAIVQQATHTSIGFANPTLYGLDRTMPGSFRDVKHANPPVALAYDSLVSGHTWLITLDRDTSLTTATGYDNVTGIGGLTYNLLTLLAEGRH